MTSFIPRFLKSIFILSCIVVLFSFHAHAADVPLKKVSCITLWQPQAQFAGYIVASEKGIYKKYGLDVNIVSGGPNDSAVDALKSGKADFGILWLSSAIQRRAEGLKLVNIGQVVQRSALMLIAKRLSGIVKPLDMQGKKVNLWEGDLQLQPRAFFRANGLTVDIIPQSYTVNLFLKNGVDVVSAMWYNEYDMIINSGLDEDELVTFFFSDYGLNFPEDGIYCLEETLNKDPQAASDFVKASFEGWMYAFDHPDEAVEIVLQNMRREHLPANRVHQKWMLLKMKDIILSGDKQHPLGILNKADYDRVCLELKKNDLVATAPAYNEFYRPLENNDQE
jgi:NitT/TauT family transport system substrate-binding protein